MEQLEEYLTEVIATSAVDKSVNLEDVKLHKVATELVANAMSKLAEKILSIHCLTTEQLESLLDDPMINYTKVFFICSFGQVSANYYLIAWTLLSYVFF